LTKKNLPKLISVICLLMILTFTVSVVHGDRVSAEDKPLEQRFEKLETSVEKLREQMPKIAFINTDEVVTAFQEVVSEERNEAHQIQQDYLDLQEKYQKDEIGKSKFNMQNDVMRAKLIRTRIDVYQGMIDEMIRAQGFKDIADRLKEVKKQVEPTLKKLSDLVEGIPKGEISPQKVTETLQQGQEQLQQFESLVMDLIRQRIFAIAGNLTDDSGYDLLLKQGNIIYRKEEGQIENITSQVKEKVNQEFNKS